MAKWFRISKLSDEEHEARVERRRSWKPGLLPILIGVAVAVLIGVLIWTAASGTKLF